VLAELVENKNHFMWKIDILCSGDRYLYFFKMNGADDNWLFEI
jgi:hypothetical protein